MATFDHGREEPLDLIITSGRVIDPASRVDAIADVGIRNRRIAVVAPRLSDFAKPPKESFPPHPGTVLIDASEALVVPGLIDLHAHVFPGVCPLTVDADETSSSSGVTTVVSAGDAGAHTIDGFRQLAAIRSRTRVLAFLHVSTIGLAAWPVGEALNLECLDVDAAVRAAVENPDLVVGIKVRITSPDIVGPHGLQPLQLAREVGQRTELPLMVHIGGSARPLPDVYDLLRPGDIVTHCFTPATHGILDDEGRVSRATLEARQRGVRFDVGHGLGSFSYDVAETAAAVGFWPDTISTDLHSLSAGLVHDLPTTMSRFLGLGMSLEDIVRSVTATPAEVLGRRDNIGSLTPGAPADVTVLDLVDQELELSDSTGAGRLLQRVFCARHTIRAGVPWGKPALHPGRIAAAGPPDAIPPAAHAWQPVQALAGA